MVVYILETLYQTLFFKIEDHKDGSSSTGLTYRLSRSNKQKYVMYIFGVSIRVGVGPCFNFLLDIAIGVDSVMVN